ncbi:hypothetical protein [uncultured Enterovirga sp.]|uniref:hypothetical protein n=1 Tax=uncultured Enterovirga sp. TaxID=2026352 RepID=UPI0035C9C90E
MPTLTEEAFDDLNEAVSRLAYWVAAADSRALLRMTEGFGAAVAASAAMRSNGDRPETVALALAERAQALQVARDAQHAGWLLLSIELELRNEQRSFADGHDLHAVGELLREVEEIGRELMQRGTKELAEG